MVVREEEREGLEVGEDPLGVVDVFIVLMVVMLSWTYKIYQILHFKYVQLIVCQLSC